jgi:hypothetical protein
MHEHSRPPARRPVQAALVVAGLLAVVVPPPTSHTLAAESAAPATAVRSVVAADTITITIKNVALGKTPKFVGATEAAGFWIEDLLNLGINTYKLWTDMGEMEWWDDDDAQTGLWNGVLIGTPPIAAIKADAPNGFSNVIPWAWWDDRFAEQRFWRFGIKSRKGLLDALKTNGITPIGTLRTFNSDGYPEWRPDANWAPRPPVNQAFRNEWWEHCFAMAYWVNVRNDYRITHWQVLNEPNYYKCNANGVCKGQGWIGSSLAYYGGTEYEYAILVKDAYDAVKYANDMVGLPTYIHAPQAAAYFSSYVSTALDSADAAIQVVDYHTFKDKPLSTVNYVKNTIATHNPDHQTEPIFVSEFGGLGYLGPQYQTLKRAITTGDQVIGLVEGGVQGITIYNMYDWLPPVNRGIVDLLGDSTHVTGKVYTPTYYAYRLLIRAVEAEKDRLKFTGTLIPAHKALVTRDPSALWVLVMNANGPVKVNLSAIPNYGGSATLYEFSASRKDQIVGTVPVTSGVFSFSAPDSSLLLAKVPRR